jgi:hypothetical protein
MLNIVDIIRRPPYAHKYAKVRAMLDVLPNALPLPGWKDALIAGLSIAVAVLAAKVAGRC